MISDPLVSFLTHHIHRASLAGVDLAFTLSRRTRIKMFEEGIQLHPNFSLFLMRVDRAMSNFERIERSGFTKKHVAFVTLLRLLVSFVLCGHHSAFVDYLLTNQELSRIARIRILFV